MLQIEVPETTATVALFDRPFTIPLRVVGKSRVDDKYLAGIDGCGSILFFQLGENGYPGQFLSHLTLPVPPIRQYNNPGMGFCHYGIAHVAFWTNAELQVWSRDDRHPWHRTYRLTLDVQPAEVSWSDDHGPVLNIAWHGGLVWRLTPRPPGWLRWPWKVDVHRRPW